MDQMVKKVVITQVCAFYFVLLASFICFFFGLKGLLLSLSLVFIGMVMNLWVDEKIEPVGSRFMSAAPKRQRIADVGLCAGLVISMIAAYRYFLSPWSEYIVVIFCFLFYVEETATAIAYYGHVYDT